MARSVKKTADAAPRKTTRTAKKPSKTGAAPEAAPVFSLPPVNGPRADRCFGSHLSIAGGVSNAIRDALRLKFQTVQIFVKNQRQWVGPPLQAEEIAAWHELAKTPGFGSPVAHATYLINLAAADETLRSRSRDAFADELQRCQSLGIKGLVIHPGAAGEQSRDAAITRVANTLDEIFATFPQLTTSPLLELTAGQGSALGAKVEELAAIISRSREPGRIGICIDTCHAFASGYDIRTAAGYAALIDEVERLIGLDRLRCWHLNDSKGDLGSHLDRHEHIGRGKIGVEGFRHVLRDKRFARVPMILETPKEGGEGGREWDEINRDMLHHLAAE